MSARHVLALLLVALYAFSIVVDVSAHSPTASPPPHLSKRMQGWPFRSPRVGNRDDLVDQVAAEAHHVAAGAHQLAAEADHVGHQLAHLVLDENGRRPYAREGVYTELEPTDGRATNLQRQATPARIVKAENLRLNNEMPVPESFRDGIDNLVTSMEWAYEKKSDLEPGWLRRWIKQVARVVSYQDAEVSTALYQAIARRSAYRDKRRQFDEALALFRSAAREDGLSLDMPPEELSSILERTDRLRRKEYKRVLGYMDIGLTALKEIAVTSNEVAQEFRHRVEALSPDQSNSVQLSEEQVLLALQAADARQLFAQRVLDIYNDRVQLFPPKPVRTAVYDAVRRLPPWDQDTETTEPYELLRKLDEARRYHSMLSSRDDATSVYHFLGLMPRNGATWSLVCWAFDKLDRNTFLKTFCPELFRILWYQPGEAPDKKLESLYRQFHP